MPNLAESKDTPEFRWENVPRLVCSRCNRKLRENGNRRIAETIVRYWVCYGCGATFKTTERLDGG